MKMIIIHIARGCGTISYFVFLGKAGNGKRSCLLLAYALCLIVVLTGCGASGSEEGEQTQGNNVQSSEAVDQSDPFANIAPTKIADTQTGISDMSSLIKSLKQAVEADQTDEAKEYAGQMAGLWNALKPAIETADAAKQQMLQEDLGRLIQAAKAAKWDKELIIQLDYKLYQSFRDIKQKMQVQ